ncbi:uncharacterized protein [Watersipora subatra]|uniref:uncharacterized protein n=1 Tax=Watersipora subatra TaxID=2589382 RepID=UPI00355C0AD7
MVYRTSADYPNLDQLRIAKSEKKLREAILKSSKQNYTSPELEPAPSFRCVSAAEAEDIGKRLYAGHRAKRSDKTRSETADKGRDIRKSAERLHGELPYTAQVRYSKDPVRFIGRHKFVYDVAQTQPVQH